MMYVRWIFASLHLLALGIGLGAIWWRARSLRGNLDEGGIRRVLFADTLWGLAAILWISTGLIRAFAGLEKGTTYYINNNVFWIKMSLLVLVILLEIFPAINLMSWRSRPARKEPVNPDPERVRLFANISLIQSALIVAMVFAATAMARSIGF